MQGLIFFLSCEKSGVGKCWHWFSGAMVSQQSLHVHFCGYKVAAPDPATVSPFQAGGGKEDNKWGVGCVVG